MKDLKIFGEYLKELAGNAVSDILYLLGLGSTAATYIPWVGQNLLLSNAWLAGLFLGFGWANFCLYRKYAVPSFTTEVVEEPHLGYKPSEDRRGTNASVRAQIRVVNNSDKSCSIVKIRVHSEGEWDWQVERLLNFEDNSPKEISLPYSIPAHDVRQLELIAVLRVIVFAPHDIHFNRLKLEIQDQTNKTYSHWLTSERTSLPKPK